MLAASAYGKDVVDDQPGDVPVVRLSFLHIGGTGQPTIPINPGLSDERFEYAATTSLETVTMNRDRTDWGIGKRWLFEHVITIGQTRTVDSASRRFPFGQHHRHAIRASLQQLRLGHYEDLVRKPLPDALTRIAIVVDFKRWAEVTGVIKRDQLPKVPGP